MRYGYPLSLARPMTSTDGCDMKNFPTRPLLFARPVGNARDADRSRSRAFSTAAPPHHDHLCGEPPLDPVAPGVDRRAHPTRTVGLEPQDRRLGTDFRLAGRLGLGDVRQVDARLGAGGANLTGPASTAFGPSSVGHRVARLRQMMQRDAG